MTELAIRTRRAAFNAAIANRDAAAIGQFLTRNCVMITGTDSAAISGRMAQVKVWRGLFAAGDPATYVRTPATVSLSKVEPIAMEQGHWRGVDPAGEELVSGTYAAKWRMVAGTWSIEAEVFVTLG